MNKIDNKKLVMRSMDYILYFIAFTILIDRSPISITGSYVRLYQVASGIFILAVMYLIYIKELKVKINKLTSILILWFLALIISGANAIFKDSYLKAIIGQLYLLILFYVSYIYIMKRHKIIEKIYKLTIYGLFVGVIIGIIQFLFFTFFKINIGVTHMYLGLARPIGLMRETNWYAMVSLLASLPIMVHYFSQRYFVSRKVDLILFSLSLLGMFLSMTRTAFLAFGLIYIVAYLLLGFNKEMLKFALVTAGISIIIIGAMYMSNPIKMQNYINRLNPFSTKETDHGALDSRTATIKLSIDQFKKHPVIGNGAGTIGELANIQEIRDKYANGGELNTINAGPNIIVNAFYESGIIGGVIFIYFFIIIFKDLINLFTNNRKDIYCIISIVVFGGMLLFSMFNNAIRFGAFWFIISLITSYISIKLENNIAIK